MIHPTAIVDSKAVIGENVQIGPYAVIEADVSIGSGTIIGPHAVIGPFVEIQSDCRILQGAAVGGIPQSVRFEGEETHVRIGSRTIVREFVTINRGTGFGGGLTQIGEECYLMAYAHVGHDCIIGNHSFLVNNATLGGHVIVGDHVNVGAFTAVQQFTAIGDYAFIGGQSAINMDVPPYVMAVGNRAKLHGLNTVGLKRQGFTTETLSHLKKAYRTILRSKLGQKEAIEQVVETVDQIPEVVKFVDFIRTSERGITR
jgi:UDP-N-acetylglucosamine acyltransferase